MVERKQEKKRRIQGCHLMRDLCLNQGSHITTSDNFFKHVILLSRDSNFNYRAEMVETFGKMILYSQNENYKQFYDENPFGQMFAKFGLT
jgi:hypothetical protein